MDQLIRLLIALTALFLFLPMLDRRVRGRWSRKRFVQVVVVSSILIALLVLLGRRVA